MGPKEGLSNTGFDFGKMAGDSNPSDSLVTSGLADAPTPPQPTILAPGPKGGLEKFDLPEGGIDLKELEKHLLLLALARTGGNRTRAGRLLGLSRDQVRYRMEKYGLE